MKAEDGLKKFNYIKTDAMMLTYLTKHIVVRLYEIIFGDEMCKRYFTVSILISIYFSFEIAIFQRFEIFNTT